MRSPFSTLALLAVWALLQSAGPAAARGESPTAAAPASAADGSGGLAAQFATPPDSARPWVYWFWLNGNITKEGITADLEAMRQAGIGGVLIMEVDQGAPLGPVAFAGPKWRELFRHVCREAARLGLEVNMTNDAGWCGSGGPWITPAMSMQKMVWTEQGVKGPRQFDGPLAQPPKVADYYDDISVLAFPTPAGKARIEKVNVKSALDWEAFSAAPAAFATLPAAEVIDAAKIVDLTARCRGGRLAWDVPPGDWTVLRIGHTSTGKDNHPAPESGRGLECDKLSPAAADAMFAGLMQKLAADVGPLAGKTLVATHIDSWEVHSQNWTPLLRQEFQKRRGYDPYHFLPVVTGRVVDSLEVSERFLWDLRQTIAELLNENYAGRFAELARQHGMRLTIEAYGDGPYDDLSYGGRADEPMGEFWSWDYGSAAESCTEMVSAAHVYGKRIVGAESFTATDREKWLGHPAYIKALGDWAFCEGINRFVFHRYAMQPWLDRRPGMSMGPWGLHYERTQTWWQQSRPWHEYLARCQHMLRQGLFVADICYLEPENAPQAFRPPVARSGSPPDRPGYNFDGCPPEVVLTRMSVKDGRIVLPDGMSYRLLALPNSQTMTPRLLSRITELVRAGATVVGSPPVKSPSLENYPKCDADVRAAAAELWGNCDGQTVCEHRLGKGRIVCGQTPEKVLAAMGVPPDISCGTTGPMPVRYIHRRADDGTEIYFLANRSDYARDVQCRFRTVGRWPELWWPESGRIEPAAAQVGRGGTLVPLRLEATESVFVVFRPAQAGAEHVVSLTRDGQALPALAGPPPKIVVQKATYGVLTDPKRTRDVRAKLQGILDGGITSFQVAEMARGDDPAFRVVKTLVVDYTCQGRARKATGCDTDVLDLVSDGAEHVADLRQEAGGRLAIEAWRPGRYEARTTTGRRLAGRVATLAEPQPLTGPWQVQFPPGGGAPEQVTLEKLVSWNEHPAAGVKYFSGTATYRKTFCLGQDFTGPPSRVYLDLGRVQVMARVKLNGKDLGILWKPPYQVDITGAVGAGPNTLEVEVTNLWINRMIGDEQLPEDSDRNPEGTLKAWPKWLQAGKPSPTGRSTFTSWRLWKKDSPLAESGLLGPVVLRFATRVPLVEK